MSVKITRKNKIQLIVCYGRSLLSFRKELYISGWPRNAFEQSKWNILQQHKKFFSKTFFTVRVIPKSVISCTDQKAKLMPTKLKHFLYSLQWHMSALFEIGRKVKIIRNFFGSNTALYYFYWFYNIFLIVL